MIKTEAIILKSHCVNEADRILTVYSEKLGKINVSAKGVRKTESKLRYSIEPISYVQMILVEGKNFLILKDAVILDQFLEIKKDLEKTLAAQKMAVLIEEAIVGEEKDLDIWQLILETFRNLNLNLLKPSEAIHRFEKKLIKALGYDEKETKSIKQLY